jgi:hypothetical protein
VGDQRRRICSVEAYLYTSKHTERTMETLNSGQKQQLARYLEGRRIDTTGTLNVAWFGRSSFASKDRIKRLCRGDAEGRNYTAYDPSNHWWGTKSLAIVPRLIDSGIWTPVGISEDLINALHTEATRRTRDGQEAREATPQGDRECVDAESCQKRLRTDPSIPTGSRVSSNARWIAHTFHRACPVCESTPIVQFLDCSCMDEDCASWELCETCNCIHNPSKLKRLDAGAFNDKIDVAQLAVIRHAFLCVCC